MIVDIRICTGTTCYVMGASDLLTIEDYIPEKYRIHTKIAGETCPGLCKKREFKPPFVKIKGKIIAKANIKKVIDALTAEIEGIEYAYDK